MSSKQRSSILSPWKRTAVVVAIIAAVGGVVSQLVDRRSERQQTGGSIDAGKVSQVGTGNVAIGGSITSSSNSAVIIAPNSVVPSSLLHPTR